MKLFKQASSLFAAITCYSTLVVGDSYAASSYSDPERKTYLGFELGTSFSMDSNLDVPDGSANAAPGGGMWDAAPQGYGGDVGNSQNVGIGFGYNATPLVSVELNYNSRPSFSYAQYQTPSPSSIGPRTRYFDLENESIMLNGVVHLDQISNRLKFSIGSLSINTFVDAGLGYSRNTVKNLHSVATNTGYVFSMMDSNTVTSPSYQLGFGVTTALDSFWELRLGYRYFNGGEFKSSNYITDDPDNLHPSNPSAGTLVPVWSGTLQANELYAKLAYHF